MYQSENKFQYYIHQYLLMINEKDKPKIKLKEKTLKIEDNQEHH